MTTVNSSDMYLSKIKISPVQIGLMLLMLGILGQSARAQDEIPQWDQPTINLPGVTAADLGFVPDVHDDDLDNSQSIGGIDLMDAQPSKDLAPPGAIQTSGLEASPSSRPSTSPASLPSTNVSTRPEEVSAENGHFPEIGGTFGLQEFVSHFAPYEPMYIVGSTQAPNIKYQISLRYRLFTPTGPLATSMPFFRGFNIAYSQTSLWDVSNPSQPFFYDTSYRPEVFYYLESLPGIKTNPGSQLGLQGGVGHESNGQMDPNHRSLNIVFLRPIITIGGDSDWFVTFAPKFYDYIGGLPLNPDMPKYRGYADLRLVFGLRDSLQLATIGRIGRDGNKGSVQFDLTYPLTKLLDGNMDISLDAQYFYGYGDTLLTYNQRSSIFRFGIALTR